MRGRFAEIGRYLLVGSTNTLSTLAVYQLLVTILSPAVAYALAWLVGLVIVAVAYPKFVFGVPGGWARGGAIAIAYAAVFAVGLLLIALLELPDDSQPARYFRRLGGHDHHELLRKPAGDCAYPQPTERSLTASTARIGSVKRELCHPRSPGQPGLGIARSSKPRRFPLLPQVRGRRLRDIRHDGRPGGFRREVQPRRQHWFLNEKSGLPFRTPAFCSVSRGQRRFGEKEYRAPSVTPGVALRPRTQARFSATAMQVMVSALSKFLLFGPASDRQIAFLSRAAKVWSSALFQRSIRRLRIESYARRLAQVP